MSAPKITFKTFTALAMYLEKQEEAEKKEKYERRINKNGPKRKR